jgi:hypothetical protein
MTVNDESEACKRKCSWPTQRYPAFAEEMEEIHKRILLRICKLLAADSMIL